MFFGMSLRVASPLVLKPHRGPPSSASFVPAPQIARKSDVIPAHTLLLGVLGELLPWSLGGNLWPWKDLKTQNWEI